MKFSVSPTLTSYMAVSAKLPPCAGALATICRGYHEGTLRLLMLSNITHRVRAISPARVFKPGQQLSTVTGLSGSLLDAMKFHVLHSIGQCSKKLQQCLILWSTFQSTGGHHA